MKNLKRGFASWLKLPKEMASLVMDELEPIERLFYSGEIFNMEEFVHHCVKKRYTKLVKWIDRRHDLSMYYYYSHLDALSRTDKHMDLLLLLLNQDYTTYVNCPDMRDVWCNASLTLVRELNMAGFPIPEWYAEHCMTEEKKDILEWGINTGHIELSWNDIYGLKKIWPELVPVYPSK